MFPRPHSPFKQLLSRTPSASSPERCRSPDRARSPDRLSPRSKWAGNSQRTYDVDQRDRSGSDGKAPSAYFAGPRVQNANSSPTVTSRSTRAEHYDAVLENDWDAVILPHLGTLVIDQQSSEQQGEVSPGGIVSTPFGRTIQPIEDSESREQTASSMEKFESMLQELVRTEKSYVQRIEVMYQRYAVPLRQMARDRDTSIIPLYESQRLFGNIGEILGANMAFLRDLEEYMAARTRGTEEVGSTRLGDIIYRNMSCFSCYNDYFANFEKAKHIEQSMMRSNKGFRDFVDRTKYNTPGLGNIGLRELIMEPVQRIPRYTLLLNGLIKNLPRSDPVRVRLEQAVVLASRIASCEVDDKTKRAAVLWSLTRGVEGFPAALISVHRQLVDCIDVDDFPIDILGPSAMNSLLSPASAAPPSGGYRTIHCTLLLFDDVIAIAKRASSSTCSRTLLGLDNLNRLADQMKTFTERSSNAKSPNKVELGFRGLIDITDVSATDMGGPDFQVVMSRAPMHVQGDKWSGRLIRQYATADTQGEHNPDPSLARQDKYRFLESLWRAQALLKARTNRSHVRVTTLASKTDSHHTRRIIYWNVYSHRRAYLMEQHKSCATLHVDLQNAADMLPFGSERSAPDVFVRLCDLNEEEGDCVLTVHPKHADEGNSGQDVQQYLLADLPTALYDSLKSLNKAESDFVPRHGSPSTPTSSHRSRAFTNGLEQFGRSLFGTPSSIRSNATGSDLFGVRRARSKGSSQFSRQTSTSTRVTSSTANTSSVGSREMMIKAAASPSSPDADLHANIQRYRHGASPDRTITSTQYSPPSELQQHSPSYADDSPIGSSSPSPVRRKPVPIVEDSPRNSISSKRELPDEEVEILPSKRVAHERETSMETHRLSPLPAQRPLGPRTPSRQPSRQQSSIHVSPKKYLGEQDENRTPHGANNISQPHTQHTTQTIAPLSIRKESINHASSEEDHTEKARKTSAKQQIRKRPSQGRVDHDVTRDLDVVRNSIEAGQAILQRLLEQIQERGRAQINDCLSYLETSLEAQDRVEDGFHSLAEGTLPPQASLPPRAAQEGLLDGTTTTVTDAEREKLEIQIASLNKRCELLSALEKDGRLENTELHRAFNEELDRMYDDATLEGDEQIARLRAEIKQTKAKRNDMQLENRTLQKELTLERAQSEVWRSTLEKHGLI